MGTETFAVCFVLAILDLVKLNNPQMGTETIIIIQYHSFLRVLVKLNNPQMGTETPL